MALTQTKERKSHIWAREKHEHYVEPFWCSKRLFDVETFDGWIHDPCGGFGRIPLEATRAGYSATWSDIVDRTGRGEIGRSDFLQTVSRVENIVCNPPFDQFKDFALHALNLATRKVAMIWLVRTLPAARWLIPTPLKTIWLLTPRPSMPPGHLIAAGEKPGGGKQDFCWLVWEKKFVGHPTMNWLQRGKESA